MHNPNNETQQQTQTGEYSKKYPARTPQGCSGHEKQGKPEKPEETGVIRKLNAIWYPGQ